MIDWTVVVCLDRPNTSINDMLDYLQNVVENEDGVRTTIDTALAQAFSSLLTFIVSKPEEFKEGRVIKVPCIPVQVPYTLYSPGKPPKSNPPLLELKAELMFAHPTFHSWRLWLPKNRMLRDVLSLQSNRAIAAKEQYAREFLNLEWPHETGE